LIIFTEPINIPNHPIFCQGSTPPGNAFLRLERLEKRLGKTIGEVDKLAESLEAGEQPE